MTLQEIKLLHAFNAWASNRIFDAVGSLPPADTMKELRSSHGSIYGTLLHMVAAERLWLSRWIGAPETTLMGASEAPTIAALRSVWEKTGHDTARFLGTMTDRKLQDTFTMTTSTGQTFTHVLWHAIQHVVDHSTYHRGQVVALMRQLGHSPPATGLIAFYRETAKLKQ